MSFHKLFSSALSAFNVFIKNDLLAGLEYMVFLIIFHECVKTKTVSP